MESLFIKGLMSEERESLSSQLGLWHHLTLRNILQRKFTGWIVKEDHLGNFLHDKAQMASKSDILSLKLWKLNEIMRFLNIPQPEKFESNSFNAVGMEIEVQATALLRKIDKDFKGTSPDDMVRHLLIKIIENISEELKQKDIKTQDEIIQKVLEILEAMPEDQQEALKRLLSVEKFSSDIIRTAIFDHSLSTALASFMLMVKYTVYYEIAKIALVLSGALTLYVAKPYVRPLLPLIFFIFSPFGVAAIGLGLTWWTDFYTNRQIQSFLLPVMVMSSILAS
ncbi:MAG: hypothetical protein HQK74_03350, partial [Desulfamplus sp.]|nr:hypothetical protein [Desulfamplus sp.]